MIPTQQVQDLFKPLLGQFAWNVDGGVGSMLTLEFGTPHIIVSEPRVPSPGGSERVRRHLRRRHVTVRGDWHLWIQYCDWKISVSDGSCDSESFDWRQPDECLADLDGQRLIGVGQRLLAQFMEIRIRPRRCTGALALDRIRGCGQLVEPLPLECQS